MYRKINLAQELRRVAQGKPIDTPISILADLALPYVRNPKRDPKNTELRFLRRLYALEDTRG